MCIHFSGEKIYISMKKCPSSKVINVYFGIPYSRTGRLKVKSSEFTPFLSFMFDYKISFNFHIYYV